MKAKTEITIERIFVPPMAEKINELHKELGALIDKYVESLKTYGVPQEAIRNLFWASVAKNQHGNCVCKGMRQIELEEKGKTS